MAKAKKEETIEEELNEEIALEELQDGDKVAEGFDLDTGEVFGEATIRDINGKKYMERIDAAGSTYLEPLF